jgi:hypothetical protein
METHERLEEALALIANERDWRQGEGGDGDTGLCLTGAVIAAGGCVAEMDALADALPISGSVNTFNDTRPHSEVVALFEEAIANEKAKLSAARLRAQRSRWSRSGEQTRAGALV